MVNVKDASGPAVVSTPCMDTRPGGVFKADLGFGKSELKTVSPEWCTLFKALFNGEETEVNSRSDWSQAAEFRALTDSESALH